MKAFAAVFLTTMLLIGFAAAQQNSEEEQVRKAVADYDQAISHQDAAALRRMYSDDYLRIGSAGQVMNKDETIKAITRPSWKLTQHGYQDLKIRTYGDAAAVTGISQFTGEANGKPEDHRDRFLQVWTKRDGSWIMTVQQRTSMTPVPASAYH